MESLRYDISDPLQIVHGIIPGYTGNVPVGVSGPSSLAGSSREGTDSVPANSSVSRGGVPRNHSVHNSVNLLSPPVLGPLAAVGCSDPTSLTAPILLPKFTPREPLYHCYSTGTNVPPGSLHVLGTESAQGTEARETRGFPIPFHRWVLPNQPIEAPPVPLGAHYALDSVDVGWLQMENAHRVACNEAPLSTAQMETAMTYFEERMFMFDVATRRQNRKRLAQQCSHNEAKKNSSDNKNKTGIETMESTRTDPSELDGKVASLPEWWNWENPHRRKNQDRKDGGHSSLHHNKSHGHCPFECSDEKKLLSSTSQSSQRNSMSSHPSLLIQAMKSTQRKESHERASANLSSSSWGGLFDYWKTKRLLRLHQTHPENGYPCIEEFSRQPGDDAPDVPFTSRVGIPRWRWVKKVSAKKEGERDSDTPLVDKRKGDEDSSSNVDPTRCLPQSLQTMIEVLQHTLTRERLKTRLVHFDLYLLAMARDHALMSRSSQEATLADSESKRARTESTYYKDSGDRGEQGVGKSVATAANNIIKTETGPDRSQEMEHALRDTWSHQTPTHCFDAIQDVREPLIRFARQACAAAHWT